MARIGTELNPGTGGAKVAGDEVNEDGEDREFQRLKIVWGAIGTINETTAATPFPVTVIGASAVAITSVPAPLNLVGGGVEAAALRVTIASDSTGLLSVDDNGGSLTVDNPTLSVVGGGVQATALRVTLATDSPLVSSLVTEDAAAATDPVGLMSMARARDVPLPSEITAFGDNVAVNATAGGALYATLVNVAGAALIKTEDSAAANADPGIPGLIIRRDTATNAGAVDGDYMMFSADASGRLRVTQADVTQPVSIAATVTVDTELPAAAALADNTANPTAPAVGAFLMGWDGTNWDRVSAPGGVVATTATVSGTVTADTELPAAAALADNTANPTVPAVGAFAMLWDGATWDRAPGDSTNGLDVDVIRVPAPLNVVGNGAAATALRVTVANDSTGIVAATVSQATASNLNAEVQGDAAHGVAVSGNPLLNGFEARTTDGTPVTTGQAVRGLADSLGKQVVLLGATLDRLTLGNTNFTTNSAADVIASAGAGVRIVITSMVVINGHASTDTKVSILDGAAVVFGPQMAKAAGGGWSLSGRELFRGTANTAMRAVCATTGADVDVFLSGYLVSN